MSQRHPMPYPPPVSFTFEATSAAGGAFVDTEIAMSKLFRNVPCLNSIELSPFSPGGRPRRRSRRGLPPDPVSPPASPQPAAVCAMDDRAWVRRNLEDAPEQPAEPQAFSAVDQRNGSIQPFPDKDRTSGQVKHLVLACDLKVPIPPSNRPIVLNPARFFEAKDVLQMQPGRYSAM